jgi:hypothetical protein
MSRDLIYDIEVYPNIFCATFLEPKSGNLVTFEVSQWVDDWDKFLAFIKQSQDNMVRWVGFNNYAYDYQVIHKMLQFDPMRSLDGKGKADIAYQINKKFFDMSKEDKHNSMAWDKSHQVPQIDLFKIHHFDNMARSTSLKKLEFNMRSTKIQDLPYKPGTVLTESQKNELIKYNIHDVRETAKLYHKTADMIKFRETLTKKYGKNFLNHNDTKIGKDFFIMELENAGVDCFIITRDGRKPIQTNRHSIIIRDIILPVVKFDFLQFNLIKDYFGKKIISRKEKGLLVLKGVFNSMKEEELGSLKEYSNLKKKTGLVEKLNCIIDGFQFDFGAGGIHGSVESIIIEEDEDFAIIDYDVTSLYPSIAIKYGLYPQHLTKKFCEIYATLKEDRLKHAKGTPENAMLKLALNGVYGDSNNQYSPFYDPQYTLSVTINGQLILCMLAEKYLKVKGLDLIQINTDGISIKVPRSKIDEVEKINEEWEKIAGLQLERADYSKMFVRDCNNYIGLYTDGKMKRKGVYEYERELHQNHSSLIVQKAVEAHLVEGKNIEDFIKNHDNMFDFFLRTNVPRSSRLLIEYDDYVEPSQNVSRYYMSKDGGNLVKIMPALKQTKSVEDYRAAARTPAQIRDFNIMLDRRTKLGIADRERIININDGEKVQVVNDIIVDINIIRDYINYEWYIQEAYKLVKPLWQGKLDDLLK